MKSDKPKGRFRKAFTKEKIMHFLDKQGFYIVLFVCIAVIGVTAFMTSGKNQSPQELADNKKGIEESELSKGDKGDGEKKAENDKIDIQVKDSASEAEKSKDDKSKENKSEDDKSKDDKSKDDKSKDDKSEEGKPGDNESKETLASNTSKNDDKSKKDEAPKQKEEAPKKDTGNTMVYPVQGKVLKGHSVDELVYSDTLKEWTTHSGMDIEAFVGAEVKAAMAGSVEEIIEDPLMGICITLAHDNGLKTYYANLSTGNMVSVGQKVDKGQIISGVGRTASSEILDNPHLHFEVILDDKSVDPKNYIK